MGAAVLLLSLYAFMAWSRTTLLLHDWHNKVEDQLDATITIYWSSKQLTMFQAILCLSSGVQDCDLQHAVYCPKIVGGRRSGVRQHLCYRTLDLRPTTIWGQYTTCCKSQSCAPDDRQRIARNMLGCFEDQYIVTVASSWSSTLLHRWCTVKHTSNFHDWCLSIF